MRTSTQISMPAFCQRLPSQRVIDPARHCEHVRIALREAQHLKPQRQAAIIQHRQADARRPKL